MWLYQTNRVSTWRKHNNINRVFFNFNTVTSITILSLLKSSREEVLEPVPSAAYAWSEGRIPKTIFPHFYIILFLVIWLLCFCKQGEVQYFIGVQLDGSEHVEPLHNCIPESTAKESAKLVSTLGIYIFAFEFLLRFPILLICHHFVKVEYEYN